MPSGDDWSSRVSSCGVQRYCCQTTNTTGNCCDNLGQDGNEFTLATALIPTVLPKEPATGSAAALSGTVQTAYALSDQVPPPSTVTMTVSLTSIGQVTPSTQTSLFKSTFSSLTKQPSAEPPTLTTQPSGNPPTSITTTSSSTTQPSAKPPTPSPTKQSKLSTNAEPTSKGLIAAFGLTAGIITIAALFYALRRSAERRRSKRKKDAHKHEVPDRPPAFIPPLVETNGYTEWEMATNRNTHEAPASAIWPDPERGRRSRRGFF